MNFYPKKNSSESSIKRSVSSISDKVVYLHPHENIHYNELNKCFYLIEEIKEKLTAIMPAINRTTLKEAQNHTEHFERDLQQYLSELGRIEKTVHGELLLLMSTDKEAFEHFSKEFLYLCFSINTAVKWQMYYIAGVHVQDLSFREEKEHIRTKEKFQSPALENKILINEIDDSQDAFNFHHIDKRYLWGTSYRKMLINIHHRFHSLIHQITDYPDADIVENNLSAMEEASRNVINQKDVQVNRTTVREHISRMEPVMESIHTYYGEHIFDMEKYLEKLACLEETSSALTRKKEFFQEHADKLPDMRDKYILEVLSRLLKTIPFFIENTREFNHYIDRYQYNEDLLKTKTYLESAVELLKEIRIEDTELNIHHEELKRLLPKNPEQISDDVIAYYKDDYTNKIDESMKKIIRLIKSIALGAKKFPQLMLSVGAKKEIHKADEISIGNAQSRVVLRNNIRILVNYLEILPLQEIRNAIYQPLLILESELKETQKSNDPHTSFKKNKKKRK